MDNTSSTINIHQIEALKQRLLEPANIILSYAKIITEKEVYQKLEEFDDEINKIFNSSNLLIEEINKVTSNEALNTKSDQIHDFQKKTRHDLRNIVNIILGYSEMILEDLDQTHQNYVDIQNLLQETKKFNSNLEALVKLNISQDEIVIDTQESAILNKLVSMIKPLSDKQGENKILGKILIVDDNKSNCEMIERQLIREGHKTQICYDGEQALYELGKEKYDTVLLDVLMPKKNGYEVLMEMKQNLELKDIPVIMISGFKEEDTIVRCIEAGVDEYLTKPINNILLKAKIKSSLERKKFRDKQKHDLKVASEVQQSLIPRQSSFPKNFYALNTAAKGVSGDFYDFINLDSNRYAFVLADVSGKGMHAGILMAKTSALFRGLCKKESSLKKLVSTINNELCETASRGMFVTAVFGIFYREENKVEFINVGHEPVLISSNLSSFVDIESKAPPIGMFEMTPDQLKIETYNPKNTGSLMFIFTDGITEGKLEDGREFGRQGLVNCIIENYNSSTEKIIREISKKLLFKNAILHDDVTILGIKFD